ncbi:MAG: BACON domain-containing protein [Bacteroidales bacterium]|nr:BACON domain-containing protein [Bacteroidales bacterium]
MSIILRTSKIIILLLLQISTAAQVSYPDFPPADVSAQLDRDQMLWQLGIRLPELAPKAEDKNRPADARPSDPGNPEANWTNDKKYTITRSAFGLWNNYSDRSAGFFPGADSLRLGDYSPINLLEMHDGTVISTSGEWWSRRRPEVLRDVKEHLYGFIPPDSVLPGVTWSVNRTAGGRGSSSYIQKELTGQIDISRYPAVRNRPQISATLRTPANADGPVPVIIVFGGFGNIIETYWERVQARGWGICIFDLTRLQPDNGAGLTSYLIGLVNKGDWRRPGDWGTLAAWSWGVSRLIDYFEDDRDVKASVIGLTGHSRYGKATLVTMAYEPRVAIGFPSDAGSLGTKMNRRHWGQDLEHSTGVNEYHWMAGNFFRWAGEKEPGSYLPRKIEDCPVDAHSLLALCAPRPVFINAGNNSTWTDPYGMYLTARDASPVYELLGVRGLIMDDRKPLIDKAYIGGNLAYRYHTGGHTDAPDWPAFLDFASHHFETGYLNVSRASLTFGADSLLSGSLTVSSTGPVHVRSSRLWARSVRKSYAASDTVTIKVKPNRRNGRSALVTISGGGRKQEVMVNQASSRPFASAPVAHLDVDAAGESGTVLPIRSNSAWEIITGAPWLRVSDEAGILDKDLDLRVGSNPGVTARSTFLRLVSPGLEPVEISITQKGGPPVIGISHQSLKFPAAGGDSQPVYITSNTGWTLKCSEAWLKASSESGEGFRQLIITAQANEGTGERHAAISIHIPGTDARIIRVVQSGK